MNQILCTSSSTLSNFQKKDARKWLFKLLFFISIVLVFFFTIYYIHFKYELYKSERISQNLLNDFNITSIYSNNADTISQEIKISEYKSFSSIVIGVIEIKKLNIVYPILSEINKDLLKISPCRFFGPEPNKEGNLCIAAHNYKNDTFFSNIPDLVNGDIITIYDTSNNYIDYFVYNVYTTFSTNLDCISQNTGGQKVVTLITCDKFDNNYRTIVQAKAI